VRSRDNNPIVSYSHYLTIPKHIALSGYQPNNEFHVVAAQPFLNLSVSVDLAL
jgi:hypothetical protein